MKLPRSVSGWTVAVFGAMALLLGAVGLAQPDVLLVLLGFDTLPTGERAAGDYTHTFMTASSMASFNMGVYYLLASVTDWRPFFLFSVIFRLVTTVVFTVVVVAEVAPVRFVGVAAWEGLGAVVTGVALLTERRRRVGVPSPGTGRSAGDG
ncbi:hypothetical protein O7543_17910 [Solwaraspora sp. WMMA2080]|uniref:hypothetical protein n=1 Tax=unclassified Solwaraspora TaxID=2627926 RepID=UPI00248AE1A2|nr:MULTISPECIES: hypothetical protein [unclassified Solwaraspora]WBB97315.1 hypothetical protein O7553_29450 [Solwaraspora sp. WMMA2059]WBC18783.1 hypothetical protein O7543_17910 [Solwaraspora sp. WMMA2080]